MAEVTIDRSLDQVWSVFTDVSSWQYWHWPWPLVSVTPEWQPGAKLQWSSTIQTVVFDFVEKQRVSLLEKVDARRHVWLFSEAPPARTSVSLSEERRIEAAPTKATHERMLLLLKACVESRYPCSANAEIPAAPVEDAAQLTRTEQLLRAVKHYKSTSERDAARAELRQMANLVPSLIAKLKGTAWQDRDKRMFAASALGEIGDSSAVPALVAVLEVGDSSDETWRAASVALAKIGDPQAIEPLLAVFREGRLIDEYVFSADQRIMMQRRMVAAAYSLALLGVLEVEDELKRMIAHAGDHDSRPYVTTSEADELKSALKQLRSKCLSPAAAADAQRRELLDDIRSSDIERRKTACYESVAVGGAEVIRALIDALEHDSGPQYNQREDLFQSSRKGAAFALGKLGDPSSAPALLKALKNDFPWEAKSGKPVQRLDNPHRMDLGMPVFGTSVREGLKEADTEFARSLLSQVPALPFSTAGEIGRALSASTSTKAAPAPVPKSPTKTATKKFWQFWR